MPCTAVTTLKRRWKKSHEKYTVHSLICQTIFRELAVHPVLYAVLEFPQSKD